MKFSTRREFLYAGLANTVLFKQGSRRLPAPVILDPSKLAKFVDPLPIPVLAQSIGRRSSPHDDAQTFPYYRLVMSEVRTKVHRDLPATRFWGFDATSPGPTIEARRGQPLLVEWVNHLPREHFLPIDRSLHGAESGTPDVRTVIHLHGGRVPPESDGYPENWYIPGKASISHYPNEQESTLLWYHDHAMAVTRLNIYAGLFGLYVIRDAAEDALNLPRGPYEIPIVLYDRAICRDGQLYYPVSGDPGRPWVPEFFGEAILVNGKLFPYLDVEPRKYRFRVLNCSNSRFYYLSLSNGMPLWQIGSDQGLMAAPVQLRNITLAPGERADVVVDFHQAGGQSIVLKSDAYVIMQFRVSENGPSNTSSLPKFLQNIERTPEHQAIKTRVLTLGGGGDTDDPTSMAIGPMMLNGAHWSDPVTETPTLDTVEIWNLVNLTDDSHPIHLHMVRFQILDRRPFDLFAYLNSQTLNYTAAAIPPDANEAGWKDTVRADPGMVTRIIVRFEGYPGRYVWHCHVLEHEDNEMMRPYDVLPSA